jgi:serine/threonine-protein kinase
VPPAASSFVPGLPPELDAFLARCLEKDPAQRFQTTADFVHGLAVVENALFASGPSRGQTGPAAALAR